LEERRVALLERLARKNTELEIGQSKMISDIAYAAGTAKSDQEAARVVETKRQELQKSYRDAMARAEKGNVAADGLRMDMMRRDLNYLDSMKVLGATRDAVAVKSSEGQATIGYRGTAQLRDFIPDFQLAINSKKVGRLEEAKKFAAEIVQKNQIANKDLKFTGHSLGGYLAEGSFFFFFLSCQN
jgi:hypothetical protein